jgi:Restriction endonuclease
MQRIDQEPDPPPLIGRDAELIELREHFARRPASTLSGALVFGPAGVGKFALARTFASRYGAELFPGGIWSKQMPPQDDVALRALRAVAHELLADLALKLSPRGRSLVILADSEASDRSRLSPTCELILDRAKDLSPTPSFIILRTTTFTPARRPWRVEAREIESHEGLPFGMNDQARFSVKAPAVIRLPLRSVYRSDVRRALVEGTGGSTRAVRSLVKRSGGDIRIASLILGLIQQGETAELIAQRFEPVELPSCVDLGGVPLRDPPSEMVTNAFEQVSTVGSRLADLVTSRPELIDSLTPREFEELVAELYERAGFHVELTPASRDGGFDIYARHTTPYGKLLTLIECKKYARERRVGVRLVRHLFGVVEARRAHAGVVATTTTFTRGARDFADMHSRIALQDYFALQDMLKVSPSGGAGNNADVR